MYPRPTVARLAPQLMRNLPIQGEHDIETHRKAPGNTAAGRRCPSPRDEDAHIMAMLDEHLAFTLEALDALQLSTTPQTADSETESEPAFSTPASSPLHSGCWSPHPSSPASWPLSQRPTSSGTMFVDWNDYGPPLISYRNASPDPPLSPQLQRRASEATLFVDWDERGAVQVSYRDRVVGSYCVGGDLVPGGLREEYMGVGVGRGDGGSGGGVRTRSMLMSPPQSLLREEYMGVGVGAGVYADAGSRSLSGRDDGRSSRGHRTRSTLTSPPPSRVRQASLRTRSTQTSPPQPQHPRPSRMHQGSPPIIPNPRHRSDELHMRHPDHHTHNPLPHPQSLHPLTLFPLHHRLHSRRQGAPPHGGYQAYQPPQPPHLPPTAPPAYPHNPIPSPHPRPPPHHPSAPPPHLHTKPLPAPPNPTPTKQSKKRDKIATTVQKVLGAFCGLGILYRLPAGAGAGARKGKASRKAGSEVYVHGGYFV